MRIRLKTERNDHGLLHLDIDRCIVQTLMTMTVLNPDPYSEQGEEKHQKFHSKNIHYKKKATERTRITYTK